MEQILLGRRCWEFPTTSLTLQSPMSPVALSILSAIEMPGSLDLLILLPTLPSVFCKSSNRNFPVSSNFQQRRLDFRPHQSLPRPSRHHLLCRNLQCPRPNRFRILTNMGTTHRLSYPPRYRHGLKGSNGPSLLRRNRPKDYPRWSCHVVANLDSLWDLHGNMREPGLCRRWQTRLALPTGLGFRPRCSPRTRYLDVS
jgi:hypothetical protein